MSEDDFLSRWEPFQEVLVFELLRRGKEITLLSRLVPTPRAAGLVLARMASSNDRSVREGAAALAGLLSESAPLDVLAALFARETSPPPIDPLTAFAAQENVRALVFSAARWCRSDRARDAGLALCRDVVERTIAGGAKEHWTASPFAMSTLVRHRPEEHRALLDRFAAWANGDPPAYLVPTTLQSERSCARALLAGNENALRRVDALIDKKDAEGMVAVPARMRESLERLLALASELG